jgi:predicted aldo/keto reductase-like oxidoreductase
MNESVVRVKTRHMKKTGDDLSILGYGCMRFKRKLGGTDMEKAERQVRMAIEAGVNYFDTAWLYPGNETAIGAILEKQDKDGVRLRDRVNIATKLPLMTIKNGDDIEKCFNTSLQRLRTDHIDYYLMHNINNVREWERIKRLGIADFIEKWKASGQIRHIGFSYHGNLQDFKIVVDDYPWEFVQLQYNYLDEHFQAGTEGLRYAAAKDIGIVIMEPLRGGMLIDKMPPAAKKMIDGYTDESGQKRSAAEWGLRWLWNHPEVIVALSGMNEDAHITENVRIAAKAEANHLTSADLAMIEEVKGVFERSLKVKCTGCAYCLPCPAGVNIPQCFAQYNSKAMFGGVTPTFFYLMHTAGGKKEPPSRASLCKKCGLCEKKCPQCLPIMDSLDAVVKDMEKPLLKMLVGLVTRIMGR